MKSIVTLIAPVALIALIALAACSPRTPSPPLPARPALGAPIDRAARALVGNALISPFDPDVGDRRKEAYNRASPSTWPDFVPDFAATLAVYDGLDRSCGNQWLAAQGPQALARLLADDRLWVDSRATTCTHYLAVERGIRNDCGGRTPLEDASDVFRSLLVDGTDTRVTDGVDHDDRTPSTTAFPFLASP